MASVKERIAAIEAIYGKGNTMKVLSQALRGALVPSKDKQFYVADYAGIEAGVLLWLAEDEEGMALFRQGNIYCEMASDIYQRLITKEQHPTERALGKVAILGLGYQMGAQNFVDSAFTLGGVVIPFDSICINCGDYASKHTKKSGHFPVVADPDEMTAVKVVDAYRAKFWKTKAMWQAQQDAAIEATRGGGKAIVEGRVEWQRDGRFLFCTLPSGRRLAYADPQVSMRPVPWNAREKRPSLSFMGVAMGGGKWTRQHTYGGSLVENTTQAVARDLMAAAMLRCDGTPYEVVLTVHDEIVAEAPIGFGSVKGFEKLLTELPEWAEGCPIGAEGFVCQRYQKN